MRRNELIASTAQALTLIASWVAAWNQWGYALAVLIAAFMTFTVVIELDERKHTHD